jgi:hypothetical protein
MGSLVHYACYKKEMLGSIHEKLAAQELAPGGGWFFASGSKTIGNGASACSDSCVLGRNYSTTVGNDSWDNAYTFD